MTSAEQPAIADPVHPHDPIHPHDIDLSALRRSYEHASLDEGAVAATWLEQFRTWFAAAQDDEAIVEPNAMQLATADAAARTSVRTVLVKSISTAGLTFYTGYDSAKGRDLAQVPWAAAIFAWLPQQRQVRFAGPTLPIERAEIEQYFATRPRGSQIGAWASPQSQVVAGRHALDAAVVEIERRFDGVDVPAPPRWGGFRLEPVEVEFWQGRANRMHDRIRFRRAEGGHDGGAGGADGRDDTGWLRERLAP